MFNHLPGGEILKDGLRDLQDGVQSVDALLVLVAAPRLTRWGIPVPQLNSTPSLLEHDLFHRPAVEHGPQPTVIIVR